MAYGVRCGFEGWDEEMGVLQWGGIMLLRRSAGGKELQSGYMAV